jgi:predicted metal-binding protein
MTEWLRKKQQREDLMVARKSQEYIEYALSHGAKDAVEVNIGQIVFDHRTYLKCMYGCTGSNPETLCHSQPGRIKPWEYEPILKKYAWGLLIHSNDNRVAQKISIDLEKMAFKDGYYFAFSLSDCDLCGECSRAKGMPCVHYTEVRPSMHSAGIDVFKTVHGLGLPLHTLRERGEDQNCYSLVLCE